MRIIGGKHRSRTLIAPKGVLTRPSSSMLREAVFNICQHTIEGANFLDLFAGAGAMGLEALSRGASHAVFVDNSALAIAAIKKNIQALKEEERSSVFFLKFQEALRLLAKKQMQFDIIFADPPYNKGYSAEVLQLLDTLPLLAPSGAIFIEEEWQKTEDVSLKNFTLKNERRIGMASLRYYNNVSI